MSKATFEVRALFGGAMVLAVPIECRDMAPLRQIPDNQEVMASENGHLSVIVEVLEMLDGQQTPAALHWQTIAEDNAASAAQIEFTGDVQPFGVDGSTRSVCHGLQRVSKFNEADAHANNVFVAVCCIRLLPQQADVVISFNAELAPNTDTSGFAALFESIVSTFEIRDYSLFDC
eukprot:m.6801 g.6801  ORF g.6801 m.6801 type:complete len:175 (+) comp2662_c0_seq1:381-905(+)